MKKLIAIGEALIDMIPTQSGKPIKETEAFMPVVGGAPANVCGAFAKLSGNAYLITQVGKDPFGDKITDCFQASGIHCDYVSRTEKANTALAFVSLMEDGNREFSFYRKPSADMLLAPQQIQKNWFEDVFALHFCSVSLGDTPMKQAHRTAIAYARECGGLISFDPNLRFNLWESADQLKEAVWEFLPFADIVKVSDEELEFLTGTLDEAEGIRKLFTGQVKLVIYTKGKDGAQAYMRDQKQFAQADGVRVKALDTTGAGDGFIGSFLYQLYEKEQQGAAPETLTIDELSHMLAFSNAFCARSVLKPGGISSYPTKAEMQETE